MESAAEEPVHGGYILAFMVCWLMSQQVSQHKLVLCVS